jgi:RHS repeat-associated protein
VGNITTQEDAAQQTVYFNGMIAESVNAYTYDAIYRLIIAGGRELIGLNTAPNYNDSSRTGQPLPTDTSAMQPYIQYYTYDAVGNMLQMKHTASTGVYVNYWTRNYTISGTSNRLTSTSIGSNNPASESYTYDARGNMASGMNHLTSMAYNEVNQLQTVIDASGTITTYYQYDYEGQRVRKVSINTGANQTQTRKYFGYWELYDKIDDGTGSIILERETLQIMDDSSRIALIDTPTIDTTGSGEVQLLRYQFSNNLSTATLELDDSAAVITYEEYYPFGSTSFQCGRSGAEVSLKRYRFTGKERDDESGFYYHGARYYAPWLARWTQSDPLEIMFSPESPYNYGHNNPIIWQDSTGMQAETTNGSGGAGGSSGDAAGGSTGNASGGKSGGALNGGTLEEVTITAKRIVKSNDNAGGGGSSDSNHYFLTQHETAVQDVFAPDHSQANLEMALERTPPPNDNFNSSISQYKPPTIIQSTKQWLSQQSVLSPFAWFTGHSSPPPSAGQDLAKELTYFAPVIGINKALAESGLGIASGKPTTGDFVNLGLAILPSLRFLPKEIEIANSGGRDFEEYKAAKGGGETYEPISTTDKRGNVVDQPIRTEYHHMFITQRVQKAYNLSDYLVNNRINVWRLNTVQHALIDKYRFQFLYYGFKPQVGWVKKYNWFTNFKNIK